MQCETRDILDSSPVREFLQSIFPHVYTYITSPPRNTLGSRTTSHASFRTQPFYEHVLSRIQMLLSLHRFSLSNNISRPLNDHQAPLQQIYMNQVLRRDKGRPVCVFGGDHKAKKGHKIFRQVHLHTKTTRTSKETEKLPKPSEKSQMRG